MAGDWDRLPTPTGLAADEPRSDAPLTVEGEREPVEGRRRLAAGSEMLLPVLPILYRVRVRYREPGYERRHGARAEPYEWRCEVRAGTGAEAVDAALAQFRALQRKSSVGWTRLVIDAVASPADPRDAPDAS